MYTNLGNLFNTEDRLVKSFADLTPNQQRAAEARWPHSDLKNIYIFQVRDCDELILSCRVWFTGSEDESPKIEKGL